MASEPVGINKTNIEKLKHYQALETYAARLLGGWMPGIERWETKKQVGYHLWEDMQFARQIRTRLWELRVNQPDRDVLPRLDAAFQLLAAAQSDFELLAGAYLVLKSELRDAYERYIATTYNIYDHPSVLMLRQILPLRSAQVDWARRVVDETANSGEKRRQVQRWMQFTRDVVAAFGGVDGDQPGSVLPTPPPAYTSLLPFAEARRDERFVTQLGSPAKPTDNDHAAYVVWQFSNYVQEMQAAETLATIMWEVEGMDWEFYYDIARHCWDEVRHSELGETRLDQLGYHISDFPSAIGSYAWRQLFDPLTRYCALTYVIEADSFNLKHASYQRYLEQGDLASAEPIMYDIMDETLHVRFGQKWVPRLMTHHGYAASLQELIQECREVVARHSVAPAQREALRGV